MQVAQIVPKTRTTKEDIFDYAISPEILPQIKLGILVEIPFHGRRIEGIIVNLKRKSALSSLKTIIKIVDPVPVVDNVHIELAKWMSQNYLASLGKTLFENVVPSAIRIIKKDRDFSPPIKNIPNLTLSDTAKKYLIVADFSKRLNFYLEAIKKTSLQGKSSLILVPDLSHIKFFKPHFKNSLAILHSNMTKTERWLVWNKIRQNEAQIIIGSKSALFAPIKNLGLIIIDQEENETYKNDRAPRFHAVEVAEQLSKLTAANLVLGSLTPRVEDYFKALKNIYILKKDPPKKANIIVVNMANKFQAISPTLQENIENNLAINKKIILVLNRKGEGIKYSCPDCKWIALCQKCGLPLIPNENKLSCFHCQTSSPPPPACPKCQNVNLKPFGLGTTKLEKFVKDFWPKAQIIRLEEGQVPDLGKPWHICIATSFALKFNFPPIGLVAIIDADQGLNFPSYLSSEKNFNTFYKFLKIGEKGIIQTNLEDNPNILALASLDYEKYFLNELTLRQKFGFPPFTKLIRLLYKNQNEKKCIEESDQVYTNLSKLIKLDQSKITLSKPSAAFFKKRNNNYRWQIILKIPRHLTLKENYNILEYLKKLSKDWTTDVEPIDFL